MHGTQIWGGRIEGADKSTELWSPHHIRQTLVRSQMRSRRKESKPNPVPEPESALQRQPGLGRRRHQRQLQGLASPYHKPCKRVSTATRVPRAPG